MAKRTLLVVLMSALLIGCPTPKEPDKDGGKGDGPAAADIGKKDIGKKDIGKKDIGKKDIGKKDLAKPDLAKPDAAKPDAAKPDAANMDLPGKDVTLKDKGTKDAPIPTDSAPKCDQVKPKDGAGTCGAGCFIRGQCYKVGDPKGDTCKTCDPSFSKYYWSPKKGCVVTIANIAGKTGYKDGPAHLAEFDDPAGITLDASGTVYVADINNCVIRMIKDGVVSTIGVQTKNLGSTCGFKDGLLSAAEFAVPTGVTMGKGGEVFVADFENARIRVIGCGLVKTFAGIGSCGTMNHATNPKGAYLCGPEGIASDGAGTFYVSEFSNNMIRKVTQGGVSLLAGVDWLSGSAQSGFRNGKGNQALFDNLGDILVGPSGLVLVAERNNHVIRQIDAVTTDVKIFAGTTPTGTDPKKMKKYPGCKDGAALSSLLNAPETLAYDAKRKRVYFWGSYNNCLRMVQMPGKAVSTLNGSCNSAGTGGICPYMFNDGDMFQAGFSGPEGMVVDKNGLIWVADTGNDAIRIINPN